MTPAYDKLYLSVAQKCLAGMLDYFVNHLGYSLREAWKLFLESPLSARFEQGDCSVVAGRSGPELAMDILWEKQIPFTKDEPSISQGRSREYWVGWALAYYQWDNGLTFAEIEKKVPIEKVRTMYMPYHEMDIKQFRDEMNQLCGKAANIAG